MAYVFLAITIGMEIIATTSMKYSEGFTKLIPTLICFTAYFISHLFFSRALTGINLGVAYATWCGVGIIVTSLISVFVFGSRFSAAGVCGIVFVAAGCILLNLFGS